MPWSLNQDGLSQIVHVEEPQCCSWLSSQKLLRENTLFCSPTCSEKGPVNTGYRRRWWKRREPDSTEWLDWKSGESLCGRKKEASGALIEIFLHQHTADWCWFVMCHTPECVLTHTQNSPAFAVRYLHIQVMEISAHSELLKWVIVCFKS